MGGGISVLCVVCIGDGVDIRFVVAHDKVNGWWELRGSMKHDKLGDMGCLVPMKKEAY
jgi:hypothetical protein